MCDSVVTDCHLIEVNGDDYPASILMFKACGSVEMNALTILPNEMFDLMNRRALYWVIASHVFAYAMWLMVMGFLGYLVALVLTS